MSRSRRTFLQQTGLGGIGLLCFSVNGCDRQMTPADAREEGVALRVLGAGEAAVLEAVGEVLLPGSAAAGLVHYIDHQLGAPPADSMLMIRYLGVPAPFDGFYRGGLAALERAAQSADKHAFAELPAARREALVGAMAGGTVADWDGPPAGLFYFVLRADAVDVVYGTRAGFDALGLPYRAHIDPPSRWGE